MSTPFDVPISATRFSTPEEDFDPIDRTPSFRAPTGPRDLEDTPLDMEESEILQLLSSYFDEAENARETGFNPRHEVWEDNLHAFWMRRDYADKMPWQSREVAAYVPSFVERFAAAHREALTSDPSWLEVKDLRDDTGVHSDFATRLARLALDFAGTNTSGQPVAFEHEFGNMVLTGALMKMAAAVTWDRRNGRVIVEQVDPRQCYWDPTGQGLYRVRFWEEDKETLLRKAELTDEEGEPLYDVDAIEELVAHHDGEVAENKEDASGGGSHRKALRTPILIKEWLVDLIDYRDGHGSKKVRERQLIVTANDRRIIRGPEKNPWWHGKDWVVGHPVLQAPNKSVDGRTYVELFRQTVETHENVTNRILDTISTVSMNAFEVDPDAIDDPTQIEHGIAPNQTILRSEDAQPGQQAIRAIEMGRPATGDLMTLWQAFKREAQEAAAQSDLSLGQTTSGETTATEVLESSRGQSALNNAISMDMDLGFLGPIGELVFYTALQHTTEEARGIWDGLSPDQQAMLKASRIEFRDRPFVVRARGLSRAVERSKRIRGLLGALNVIGGNPQLLQEFMREYSTSKLINVILHDFGVDTNQLKLSDEEKFQRQDEEAKAKIQAQMAAANGAAAPGGGAPGFNDQGSPPALGGADPLAQGVPEGLPGGIQ